MIFHCARLSHPSTDWQIFLPALPSDCFAINFPRRATSSRREPSDFPHLGLGGTARLSFTARIEGAHSDRAASASKKDGLTVPPPTLLRPRVARARGLSQVPRPPFSASCQFL